MPIFFLLSPGVNPDADVKVLGNGLGKTEDDEMTTLRTRVRVLERTVRERDDELRDARPRILALEAELASMRDETDGLRKANQKKKIATITATTSNAATSTAATNTSTTTTTSTSAAKSDTPPTSDKT